LETWQAEVNLAKEHKRRQVALERLKNHSVISTTVPDDRSPKGLCSTFEHSPAIDIQDAPKQLEAQV